MAHSGPGFAPQASTRPELPRVRSEPREWSIPRWQETPQGGILQECRICTESGYEKMAAYPMHVARVMHEGFGVPCSLTNGCKWPHGAVRVPRNREVHAHPPPYRACTRVGRESIIILIGFEHPVVPQGASAADGAFEYYSGESAILGPRRP